MGMAPAFRSHLREHEGETRLILQFVFSGLFGIRFAGKGKEMYLYVVPLKLVPGFQIPLNMKSAVGQNPFAPQGIFYQLPGQLEASCLFIHRNRLAGAAQERHHIMFLQIFAYTRQIMQRLHAIFFQYDGVADARELQQLRAGNRACRQDHGAVGQDFLHLPVLQIFHAARPPAVQHNLADRRVGLDGQI